MLIAADMNTYAKIPCERQAGGVSIIETWGSIVIVPEAAEKTVWAKPYRSSTLAHDIHLLR